LGGAGAFYRIKLADNLGLFNLGSPNLAKVITYVLKNYSFLILDFYSWLKVFPPCERSFDLVQIILVPCSAIIYLISRILLVLSILGFGH
jgi:hypothetical protein